MTIEWLSSKRMQGETADTKPTNVPTGTEFMNTQTRVLSIFNGTTWDDVAGGGGSSTLDGLTDVDTTTTPPSNNQVLTYNSTSSQWVPATPPGSGGGEANTTSNVGTGEGTLALAKSGVNLPFKTLKQGTNITLTNNANDVTIAATGGGSVTASSSDTFTNKDINSLTNTIKNIGEITYEVWIESGPTYKARKISTGAITSDTNVQTLFETIINAMATGSGNVGGKIYVHQGVYPLSTRIKIGLGTYPDSQVEIIGAGKDVTIFRYTGAQTGDGDESIFMPFCHTDFRNLTVDGNSLATHNITCTQAVRIGLYNIRSIKHIGIGVYIASTVKGFDIRSCQFDLASGAQDQVAINCIDYGFFIGNFVDRRTGTVLTASSVTASSLNNAVIADNVILREPGSDENAGASLALENWDKNYKNVIIENNVFYKGYVRIGSGHDVTGGATYRNIIVSNNVLDGSTLWVDGPSATSATNTHKDIRIFGNIISDSWDVGIRVVKAAGPVTISNNMIKESNRSAVSNASNNKGLMFIDDSDFVTINNNNMYMTNTGTNRSLIGIRVQGASDRTTIRDNNVYRTNTGVEFSDSGNNTNLKKIHNIGIDEDTSSFLYTNLYDDLVRRIQYSVYTPQQYSGGNGYFGGFQGTLGANSYSTTSGPGGARIVETGTTSGNKAGQATDKGLRRAVRPSFVFIIRPNTTVTNQGIFIGFASSIDGTSVHATTPINAQSGVGMAMTTDKTNYQFVTNDGTTGCQFYDTGVAANTTTIRTFEIWFDGTNWYGRVDANDNLKFTLSTDIPASSTVLFPQFYNVTNTAALANFYHYGMVIRNYSVEQS